MRTMFHPAAFAASVTLLAACVAAPAQASRPVPKTVVGCVVGGVLIGDSGYTYRVRQSGVRGDVDLTPYEGRHIRWEGSLLPGDRFIAHGAPRDLGPCPDDRGREGGERDR